MKGDVPLIAVVGSLNVDHTFLVPRIPERGETLMARQVTTRFGGKGANQAIAAARAGAQVRMIGCVGEDDHGTRYREHLVSEGVDAGGVCKVGVATGSASITVDEQGENAIVVHPGANYELDARQVDALAHSFEGVGIVLLQLECPVSAVARAAEIARQVGATVILNPSPWQSSLRGQGIPVDVLIVNEVEAVALAGGGELDEDFLALNIGCSTVIVTRGAKPTRVISLEEASFEAEPPGATPVDTVGAGDAFAGAFAAARGEGKSLVESVEFANAAASLATLTPGAQEAIPTRAEILAQVAG